MSGCSYCYPSQEKFMALAGENNLIPIYREIVADLETPVSIYTKIFKEGYSCLLESVEGNRKLSRYSFIAGEPFLILKAYGNSLEITTESQTVRRQENLIEFLREVFSSYKTADIAGLPRFYGGAVGYIGYDCVRLFERLPQEPPDELNLPDAFLIFPESVIVFDHYSSKLKIIVNARIDSDCEAAYKRAVKKIEQLTESIRNKRSDIQRYGYSNHREKGDVVVKNNITRQEFHNKVEKIKDYIFAGDILQAVLSQRFEIETGVEPFEAYRALRSINPSPYMFYLNFDQVKIAGASPEMLVRLEDGIIENRPIAGTRPRGKSPEDDLKLEEELINDPKERAEHVMLVDLGRNDLGRVSRYGSVEVPVFMNCERYSHVMHLVSEVRGKLEKGKDALDALVAGFPAGTVSGAPKIRAMEIIDELEPTKRGPYAGAVGYFSFNGNMDTCITIRTIIFTGGKALAQAGAGIVADSRPDSEYEETVSKARVLIKALQIARGDCYDCGNR